MVDIIMENELQEFVKRLPDIEPNPLSAHLLLLAVRSRFVKAIFNLKIKDMVVERKIIRPNSGWRETYVQKVYNLALLQQNGRYTFRDIGQIPKEGRAIFGTVIPRNVTMAVKQVMSDAIGYLTQENLSDDAKRFMVKFDNKFFGALHSHRRREMGSYITIDIDNAELFTPVRDMLTPLKTWMITKTSRGYHIIKDLTAGGSEEFHKGGGIWDQIHTKYGNDVELQRDSQEPIPGTIYLKIDAPNELNFVRIIE